MFFYMHDIVFIFLVEWLRMVEVIVVKLKKCYDFMGGGDL